MSLHIQRFINLLRAAESRQQREVTLTINEARDLHADITRLLLARENNDITQDNKPETIEVRLSGGTFI
jgi:hypothetical protein